MQNAETAQTREALPRLPNRPQGLTPAMLTNLISRMHPGLEVKTVEIVDAGTGGGKNSASGRVKLHLTYGGGPHGIPEHVQVKMIIGARSRVPALLYQTEVNMYRRLLPGLALERPHCLAAEYESETGNYILLLEDVSRRGAVFSNVLDSPFTSDEVGALLDQLAILHAHYWENPQLNAERDWLSTHIAGSQFEYFDSGKIVDLLQSNIDRSTYRQDLAARIGLLPAELWARVKAVQRFQAATIPATLCHGDAGAHNSYRLPRGQGGFVDWQLSVNAAWTHDVHYLICTALSVKDRRLHERALVQRYISRLQALGIAYHPTLDEAMDAYSLAINWGFTIGWFTVWPEIYGMEIITANLERMLAAVLDHDAFNRAAKLL